MTTDFKQLLIASIPFKENDVFFKKSRRSVDIISALGITTIEELLSVLEDTQTDSDIRIQLSTFATWLNYQSAIHSFIQIVTNQSEDVHLRRAAMVDLAILGRSKSFKTLKDLSLNDPKSQIRIGAIAAFTVSPSKRAFNLVTKIMYQDNDPEVRGAAIRAISSIPQSDKQLAFELLLAKFTDVTEDIKVRAYAAEGLGYLKDKRAIDIIISNLSNEAPEIRYMCAYAVGLLGNETHIPLLEAMKSDTSVFEGWGTVAEGAKEGLEEIKASLNND